VMLSGINQLVMGDRRCALWLGVWSGLVADSVLGVGTVSMRGFTKGERCCTSARYTSHGPPHPAINQSFALLTTHRQLRFTHCGTASNLYFAVQSAAAGGQGQGQGEAR